MLLIVLSRPLNIYALDNQSIQSKADSWKLDSTGWWYQHANGSYTRNGWEFINGKWYYFDNMGYMTTGWQYINGGWYHMNNDGAMDSNQWIGNYYVGSDGCWRVDHWINNSTGWWYQHADGSYTRNGWEMINGGWYYFDNSGYMATGWRYVNANWYHRNDSGLMDADRCIGNYYVDSNGVMATNRWIGNYHVNNEGVWDYTAPFENNVQTVYWSGNGKRYHNDPNCNGLRHKKTSLSSGSVAEAVARGLTPCGICYR